MAAPKGNTYAAGLENSGRPRTTSFSPEDMIALGQEMVEFVSKKAKTKDKLLHLREWYSIEKMFTYKQWKTFIQREEFIPYYEQALSAISRSYLDGTISPTIGSRFLRRYFGEVREQEDEDAQLAFERAKAINGNLTPEDKDQFIKFMAAMSQAQSSALKIDDNNNNADAKS